MEGLVSDLGGSAADRAHTLPVMPVAHNRNLSNNIHILQLVCGGFSVSVDFYDDGVLGYRSIEIHGDYGYSASQVLRATHNRNYVFN